MPGIAPALADALVGSTTFATAYDTTLDVLAEGGVSTKLNNDVRRTGKAPESRTYVFPVLAADLALEAADRETMATFTLSELSAMMDELGWPQSATSPSPAGWVRFFADWYAAAEADPDAPDSFAIFFIAAMNQRQEPPANIATGLEDPSAIRLSLLELELLLGAIDRIAVVPPAVPLNGLSLLPQFQSASPCSDFVKQTGLLGQAGQIVSGEVTGAVIGKALESWYGDELGGKMGNALNALGTASKLFKLMQQLRFGYIKLELATDNPVRKPIAGAANKQGRLRAIAGVDNQKFEDARGSVGPDGTNVDQAIYDCMNALNLPSFSDARDVAADAENWRVSWSIVSGGSSQVLWSPGQQWDISGRYENKLTRVDATTAKNEVSFDILPQATRATVGKERRRKATFKVQLRRGSIPDLSTLWGSGKAGAAAAYSNPVGAALGLADVLTDISTKWILEGASPSAYTRQDLIEIEPTGLIGSVRWTSDGSARRYVATTNPDFEEVETAVIAQEGFVEIVSSEPSVGNTTAYGSEVCKQRYQYGNRSEAVVEGSEVVGTRVDIIAADYSEGWTNASANPPDQAAVVVDQTTPIEGIPAGYDYPGKGTVQIILLSTTSCGFTQTYVSNASILWTYESMWTSEETFERVPLTILPAYLPNNGNIIVPRTPDQKSIAGSADYSVQQNIQGMDVDVRQHVEWNLHWVE